MAVSFNGRFLEESALPNLQELQAELAQFPMKKGVSLVKLRFWTVYLIAAAFLFATVNFTGCGIYRKATSVSGSGDDTVVVTASSRYYHRRSCRDAGLENKEFFLSDAVQIDYKPCPTCRPPHLKADRDSGNAETEF